MSKVKEMLNTSQMSIPVELASGLTVYVGPRQKIENEDVANLDKVRRYFKVTEDLSEPKKQTGKKILNG